MLICKSIPEGAGQFAFESSPCDVRVLPHHHYPSAALARFLTIRQRGDSIDLDRLNIHLLPILMNYNLQEFKFLTGPNENIPSYKETGWKENEPKLSDSFP